MFQSASSSNFKYIYHQRSRSRFHWSVSRMLTPEQIPLRTRHTPTAQMHHHHSHPHPCFISHNSTRYVAHQLEYLGLINKKQLKLHRLFNLYLLLPFLYPANVNWGGQQEATFEVARASWRGDGKPWPPEHHRRNTGIRP